MLSVFTPDGSCVLYSGLTGPTTSASFCFCTCCFSSPMSCPSGFTRSNWNTYFRSAGVDPLSLYVTRNRASAPSVTTSGPRAVFWAARAAVSLPLSP